MKSIQTLGKQRRCELFEFTGLLEDFLEFSRHHIDSGDIDPLYPVLRHLEVNEQFIHQYVAFYNLPSAYTAWGCSLQSHTAEYTPEHLRLAKAPTGVERRGLRGGHNLIKHLVLLNASVGEDADWEKWSRQAMVECPFNSWKNLEALFQTVWGNGRWAAYKLCDLYRNVLGYKIEAPDCGHEFSTSPRKGCNLLFVDTPPHKDQSKTALKTLNEMSDQMLIEMRKTMNLTMSEVETCFCDFHTMWKGRYYVGHDIDALQGDIMTIPKKLQAPLWDARKATLLPRYLGELNDWCGVQDYRMAAYRDNAEIWVR